jgi:HNH endonuclease
VERLDRDRQGDPLTIELAPKQWSLSVWNEQRVCAVCGAPGANAHHVVKRSQGGRNAIANGVLLCGSGTTGCHGLYHSADPPTMRAIGAFIVDSPAHFDYLDRLLGPELARSFLARNYLTEVPT